MKLQLMPRKSIHLESRMSLLQKFLAQLDKGLSGEVSKRLRLYNLGSFRESGG